MNIEQTLEGQKSTKNIRKVTSVEISEREAEGRLEEQEYSDSFIRRNFQDT